MSQQHAGLRAVLPLFLVIFIDAMGMGILFPILNPIFMDSTAGIFPTHISEAVRDLWYGITLAVFPLGMFFAAPILGDISDQIGRKKVLLFCLLGAFASYAMSGVAVDIKNLWLLIISRLLGGLTAGSQPIAQAAVIDVSPPEQKTQNLSLLLLPACLGFVAGPLFGSYLSEVEWVSWFALSTPLYFAAIVSLFNAIFLAWGFTETFNHVHKFSIKLHRGIEVFVAAFKSHSIRDLAIIFLCFQLGWSCYFQFISLFLSHKYQSPADSIGYFMALMGVGFALGLSVFIRLVTKRWGNFWAIFGSFIVTTVAMVLTLTINIEEVAWLMGLIISIAMAIAYVVMISLFSAQAGEMSQGWIMGITGAVIAFAWATMAIVSGFLMNWGFSAPISTASLFLLITVILLALFKDKIVTR